MVDRMRRSSMALGETHIFERIVINFMDACNLSCPYCYVPFDRVSTDYAKLARVVERCSAIGFRVVTFGGGDPFLDRQFCSILRLAHDRGLELHVDTNGIGIMSQDYQLINDLVSLISLPIDGSTAARHDQMRNARSHFQHVLHVLETLQRLDPRLKINTVVGRENLTDLPAIRSLLSHYTIDIWSLYQFMALHDAATVAERYSVPIGLFENATKDIETDCDFAVEIGLDERRRDSYVFVSPHGVVYTHSRDNPQRYAVLGSIFEEEWMHEYVRMNSTTIREEARHRYTSLLRNDALDS